MASFNTDAARDEWAMERLTNMLDSGVKSATEADQSHQRIGNKNAARAWRNLAIRLELLSDLVASGLFDRIKAGGPEWDAIKAYREARDAESEA